MFGRKRDGFNWQQMRVECIEIEECTDACVHGILQQVSPVKMSTGHGVHYFDVRLNNGKKCRRVVSFDAGIHPTMKKAEEEKYAVALENSVVKRSSFSQLEVQMNAPLMHE